jgi:hypothetical protein
VLTLIQPAKGDVEEKQHQFDIVFSHHCFSKEIKPNHNPLLRYGDNRELRTFCFDRYRLSLQLPAVIANIHTMRCSHTGHGNFFFIHCPSSEFLAPEAAWIKRASGSSGWFHYAANLR